MAAVLVVNRWPAAENVGSGAVDISSHLSPTTPAACDIYLSLTVTDSHRWSSPCRINNRGKYVGKIRAKNQESNDGEAGVIVSEEHATSRQNLALVSVGVRPKL